MRGHKWVSEQDMADALASRDARNAFPGYVDPELTKERGVTIVFLDRIPPEQYAAFCRAQGQEPRGSVQPYRVAQDRWRCQPDGVIRSEWFRGYRVAERHEAERRAGQSRFPFAGSDA